MGAAEVDAGDPDYAAFFLGGGGGEEGGEVVR